MNKTLLGLSVAIAIAGCGTGGDYHAGKDGHHATHWSYEDEGGPESWGSLKDEYKTCSTGQSQSPINITGEKDMGLKPIEFYYGKSTDSKVVNNGHTIQVNYAPGSYAVISGKKYDLLQFHFHSPSEHQVHGKHADLVVHLVHKSPDDGQLAVVGVLFDKDGENEFLKPIWRSMPAVKGDSTVAGTIDVNTVLPTDKGYFNYSGSLTTPPCSEGVNWNVLTTNVSVSDAQVAAFTSIFANSVRPIQPLNDRVIGM